MYIGVLKHTALGRTVPCLLCCAGEVIKGKTDASLPGTLKHFGVIAKGGARGREKTNLQQQWEKLVSSADVFFGKRPRLLTHRLRQPRLGELCCSTSPCCKDKQVEHPKE